jgi:toxin ParE1/3/4
MTFQVELTVQAESDFRALYLAKNVAESDRAARWFRKLASAMAGLGVLPQSRPLAPEAAELKQEVRQLLFGKKPHVYRIVYIVDEARQTVWVIAIRHGARLSLFDPGT